MSERRQHSGWEVIGVLATVLFVSWGLVQMGNSAGCESPCHDLTAEQRAGVCE